MNIRRGGSFSSGMIGMYRGAVCHVAVKLAKQARLPGNIPLIKRSATPIPGLVKQNRKINTGGEHQPLRMSGGDIPLCVADVNFPLGVNFGIPERFRNVSEIPAASVCCSSSWLRPVVG